MDARVVSEPTENPIRRQPQRARPSSSTSPYKEAVRTAPSPGVSSTACSKTTASGSTASAQRVPAQ